LNQPNIRTHSNTISSLSGILDASAPKIPGVFTASGWVISEQIQLVKIPDIRAAKALREFRESRNEVNPA
jgi:hypothetical protein